MKRLSVTVAAMAFFLLAGVGWACGQGPLICAVRAVIGAFALYVITRLACGLAVNILVDAAVRDLSRARTQKDQRRESGN